MIDGDQLAQHSVSSLSTIQYSKYVPCINCHTIWYCLGLKICLYSHRMHAVYNYSTSQAYLLYVQIFSCSHDNIFFHSFLFIILHFPVYQMVPTSILHPVHVKLDFTNTLLSGTSVHTIYHFSISFKDVMPLCFLFHVDCMLWQILLL